MTGFARVEGGANGTRLAWEARSVNARGLDLRFRLANGFEGLEPQLRAIASKHLGRGNCNFNLTYEREAVSNRYVIDEEALKPLVIEAKRLAEDHGLPTPDFGSFLSLRGVLIERGDERVGDDGVELASALFKDALHSLQLARADEGARLSAVLAEQLQDMSEIVDRVAAHTGTTGERMRARLAEQVSALLATDAPLDEGRLHQEAALMATRADIREEIDRLQAHIAAARELLASDQPVGRRLDFLAQEFNREANTICSKAFDKDVTAAGLELKAVIDRFREQVQNIE